MPPCAWIGLVNGCTTSPSGFGESSAARFSAIVRAGDGEAVAIEQPGVEQLAQHDGHATDAIEIDHVVFAVRLHVGDVRHARVPRR